MISSRFVINELISRHINFRIGGPAKYFFEAKSSNEIIEAVKWANEHGEPFFILGGGSNVLASDKGFNGLVIKIANRQFKFLDQAAPHYHTSQYDSARSVRKVEEINVKRDVGVNSDQSAILVYAEAGVLSALLARKTAEAGLTGFEWAVSLPGTIGGAVRGNAGCFGGETKDVISRITVLIPPKSFSNSHELENSRLGIERDLGGWRVLEINNADAAFNYRNSIFKQMNPAPIILSVLLELQKNNSKECLKRIDKNLALRKAKQPLSSSSAGCIFKNFKFFSLREITRRVTIFNFQFKNINIPSEFLDRKIIPAGWLIEQAGLLGLRIGDAEVSTKHGNFVLNRGKATAQEVIDLVQKIKDKVYQKFGVELQEEIQYVGF